MRSPRVQFRPAENGVALPGECAFVNCVAPPGNAVAMKLLEHPSEIGVRPLNVLALEQLEAVICQGAANLSAAERVGC